LSIFAGIVASNVRTQTQKFLAGMKCPLEIFKLYDYL
jgi:hypothetical protein